MLTRISKLSLIFLYKKRYSTLFHGRNCDCCSFRLHGMFVKRLPYATHKNAVHVYIIYNPPSK